jgi:hypothetical protein
MTPFQSRQELDHSYKPLCGFGPPPPPTKCTGTSAEQPLCCWLLTPCCCRCCWVPVLVLLTARMHVAGFFKNYTYAVLAEETSPPSGNPPKQSAMTSTVVTNLQSGQALDYSHKPLC